MNAGMITLTCKKCGRNQNMPLTLVLKRRNCMICGGDYDLSPEVEAQLRAATGSTGPLGKTMNLTCPVCFHQFRFQNLQPGQTMTCKFCVAPFVVPAQDGVAAEADPAHGVSAAPVQIMCPSCSELTPVPGNVCAGQPPCAKCQKPIDLIRQPVETLMGVILSPNPSKLSALLRRSLAQRWFAGKLAIAQAADILFPLSLVDSWSPPMDSPDAPISPLKATLTADLIKYMIFNMPDAGIGTIEGGDTRMIIKLSLQGGFPWEHVLRGQILERIKMSLTPMGAFKLGKDRPPLMTPLFYLLFSDAPAGCLLRAQVQRPDGPFEEFTDIIMLRVRIREKIVGAAQSLFAFRSLFGMWANIQSMQMTVPDAVTAKIAALGPEYQAQASDLTKLILNRP